jgi:hypothetical protein
MFLQSSRYFKVRKAETTTKDGRVARAVRLRHLLTTGGKAFVVQENDRLDILAQRLYEDPTMFWHIADANTELQAGDLITEPGRTINVPEA